MNDYSELYKHLPTGFINGTAALYILVDPRSSRIRYVGVTCQPRRRLYAHITQETDDPRCQWIEELKSEGFFPVMVVLGVGPTALAQKAEKQWIEKLDELGAPLTNVVYRVDYAEYLAEHRDAAR